MEVILSAEDIISSPEDASLLIRNDLDRITRIIERMGIGFPKASQEKLGVYLNSASSAGLINTRNDIHIASSAFIGAAIHIAKAEGLKNIAHDLIERAWVERLSIGIGPV